IVTMTLVAVLAIGASAYKAQEHLSMLDRSIDNAEQDLINLHSQLMQRESVEAAFNQVIEEHSTPMSQEEVHDSLRREIRRLALKDPTMSDAEQEKVQANQFLLKIPELREGVLRDDGQGYREYQIRFRIPSCRFMSAILFLSRLEASPLLLRVDELEITRAHSSRNLSLTLEVTRIVLDQIQEPETPDGGTSI
ncbi:MAG: hypothetical protein VCD00_16570, partial [Candidatus Hydrogenedentota bacterium]